MFCLAGADGVSLLADGDQRELGGLKQGEAAADQAGDAGNSQQQTDADDPAHGHDMFEFVNMSAAISR